MRIRSILHKFPRLLVAAPAMSLLFAGAAFAADPDEAELRKYYDKVDVWHARVEYNVDYSNQDVLVTRDLSPQPPVAAQLCYIRFDLVEGVGDYDYGFKPAALGAPGKPAEWGVYVRRRGNIFNQLRSILKLDVIYFYVADPKEEQKSAASTICKDKQGADTPQAGRGYKRGEWSDLVVRGKLTHGWPTGKGE